MRFNLFSKGLGYANGSVRALTRSHTHRSACDRSTMKPARGQGEAVADNDPELNLDEAVTHNASVRNRS